MITRTNSMVTTEIEARNTEFMHHFDSKSAAALADLYTEDGQLLPPNSDFVTGKPAIQAFWEALWEQGISQGTLESVEVEQFGDTSVEIGRYTLYAGAGAPVDEGKYIVIWKQTDGKWKLHRDIFNSSRPLPGQ